MPHSTHAHRMATTLKSAGDSAGMPKRPSALSMPIATAANETSGRNGIITRVSRTVSSALPGASSKPGAIPATSGQASTTPSTTTRPSATPRKVSTRLASWKPACGPASLRVRA